MVEDDNAFRTGNVPDQAFDFGVIDRLDLFGIEEIPHRCPVLDKDETRAVERELLRMQPAVPDFYTFQLLRASPAPAYVVRPKRFVNELFTRVDNVGNIGRHNGSQGVHGASRKLA